MSPFSPDTPFNYAPLLVQDGNATFSLLPVPLLYFAFGLPLLAALIMARVGWAVFYGVLLAAATLFHFPNSMTIYGGLLLFSLPVLVALMWRNDEVRFNKTLPMATCLVVLAMVPLGFPQTVAFEKQKCEGNRVAISKAAVLALSEDPKTLLTMETIVPKHLAEAPGCQGPGTSEYVVNATKDEVLITCTNAAHQREGLGSARSTFPRQTVGAAEANAGSPAGDQPAEEGTESRP